MSVVPALSAYPLSILHVAPSIAKSYGGPTYSLWGYVRAGLAGGCEVTVIAPEVADVDASAVPEGAELHQFPRYGHNAFIASPALWSFLKRRGRTYDVVHIHGLFNPVSSLSARLCIRNGWPLVIRPFGTLSRYTFTHRRALLKRVYYHGLDARNVQSASAVHFATEGEKANADWLGLNITGREHIVPPAWVPLEARKEPPPVEVPTVLFVGRLHRVKAVDSLLQAWPLVLARLPRARLVIAGAGEEAYVEELRRLATSLGIGGAVHFAGFVDGGAKQQLMDQATVVALPSYHENFGVAVLEAIANGLPVVVSPDVQLAAFVERHGVGIIAVRQPDLLARALCRALHDTPLQAHCRRSGVAIVERHFAIASVSTRLLTMYNAARAVAGV